MRLFAVSRHKSHYRSSSKYTPGGRRAGAHVNVCLQTQRGCMHTMLRTCQYRTPRRLCGCYSREGNMKGNIKGNPSKAGLVERRGRLKDTRYAQCTYSDRRRNDGEIRSTRGPRRVGCAAGPGPKGANAGRSLSLSDSRDVPVVNSSSGGGSSNVRNDTATPAAKLRTGPRTGTLWYCCEEAGLSWDAGRPPSPRTGRCQHGHQHVSLCRHTLLVVITHSTLVVALR